MNTNEMTEWLHTNTDNFDIQIPNEIFEDFKELDFAGWKHRGFAYTYLYLVTYIYRNALYGRYDAVDYSQDAIISTIIKNRTQISYITKKDGLLENAGYVESTKDYPIGFFVDNDILQFTLHSDLDKFISDRFNKVSKNFSLRKPVIAFDRWGEDFTGTFYDYSNTHRIPIDTFIKILCEPNLGYCGVYMYGYFAMMNDKYPEGFKISNEELSSFFGCNIRTIIKYTKKLEELGFITHKRSVIGYRLMEKEYSLVR